MLGVLKLPTHMQGFLHPLGKRELRMIRKMKLIINQETAESTATSANLKQLWTAPSWKVNFKISFLNTTVFQENHLSIIITPVNQAAFPSEEWRTHRRNQREAADRRVQSRDKCSRGIVSRSGDSLLLTVTRVKHEIHHHPREYHHNLQPLLTSLRIHRKSIKGEKMIKQKYEKYDCVVRFHSLRPVSRNQETQINSEDAAKFSRNHEVEVKKYQKCFYILFFRLIG